MKVEIPFEVADLVERVFLPSNPRKMRKADPTVVEAVKRFKAIMSEARYTRTPTQQDDRQPATE